MKLVVNKTNPPLGGLIGAEYLKSLNSSIEISWGDETYVEHDKNKIPCQTSNDVLRYLGRNISVPLYGPSAVERTEIDHWLTFTRALINGRNEMVNYLSQLDKYLAPVTYLSCKRFTIADFAVFGALYESKYWKELVSKNSIPINVVRWFKYIESQDFVSKAINNLPPEALASVNTKSRQSLERQASKPTTEKTASGRAKEGKFVELPGAEMGKVVVRFPPEASGYLHIGHAKAALLNQYYQQAFQGKLIMRFDDTNPAKENADFEKVILEDVEMLQIQPDLFTHTSQYFDLMLDYCEKLIKEQKAYVDDTDAETMKQEREQRVESVNRANSVEKNLQLWKEMVAGSEVGQKCCVRAKIDMQSANGCMRDPTIYRCKNEEHPRTGTKYRVYPTYDFACPIVDAIENVTHVLRTMEYHDRDPQFYWFIEALGLRKPHIWEYSRLSMTNTVLSKRKLAWFVSEGYVDGWDDPRMPTVRGILRRGMTVEGLKEFIIAQGSSRSVVFMEWDKIWAFNKKVIDPVAPRYTSVDCDSVTVLVKGAKEECLVVPKHPKNQEIGNKSVWVGPKIIIDRVDADCLKEGENATFINWGNLLIKKINRHNGKITTIEAEPNLDNKDYKKTLKSTFLAVTEKASFTPTYCVYFDYLISKALLGKDEDFKKYASRETRKEIQMIGDPELKNLKKGDIIQLQRRGFFRVDVAYEPASLHSCKEQPVILFYVPDGHTKANPLAPAINEATTNKTEVKSATTPKSTTADSINQKIIDQGNTVRNLKAQKSPKGEIDAAVKTLLTLKAEYKTLTGTEWKPGPVEKTTVTSGSGSKTQEGAESINKKIIDQGNIVRDLKAQKSPKGEIDAAVKTLLSLKAEYKTLTGTEWKPGPVEKTPVTSGSGSKTQEGVESVNKKIIDQGNVVRDLKAKKAAKGEIDTAVKLLLSLKAEFKALSGNEWKPGCLPDVKKSGSNESTETVNTLNQKITNQGNIVRDLKAKKASKGEIDAAVKILLGLKAEFKALSGNEWKPSAASEQQPKTENKSVKEQKNQSVQNSGSNPKAEIVNQKIIDQGNTVRNLKAQKAEKAEIDKSVKALLDLKSEYKSLTGVDWKPASGNESTKNTSSKKEKTKEKPAPKVEKTNDQSEKGQGEKPVLKKQTRLGLEAKKEEKFSEWYSQIITKGEMCSYYDVSGCYILRPWSMSIWEEIKNWFDAEIKALGVKNCYFPMFVSRTVLEKEKDHIADFAPEVAWVTKAGESDLAEPIAIRPTSETVMYPEYAKWIQSYRDLPIKLNQWNNVVRWEFKHPQPFLRTREFLWQEGHTAYADKAEAMEEVKTILDLYARIYTDLLAIPVIKGKKTMKEKFAGGEYTLTVEAYISTSGRAIQGATSHHLGQNFSKMFEITYEDPKTKEKNYVYQNSWGITTRTIGVMIMIHSDNQGLVLPPRVASVQVMIVPCGITVDLSEEAKSNLQKSCQELEKELLGEGVRVEGDYRLDYSPGWKFNHWELKGVPIRIELGPKDIEKNQVVAVRRDTGKKLFFQRSEAKRNVKELLEEIQSDLLKRATDDLENHLVRLTDWNEFLEKLEMKKMILVPFCGEIPCEDRIKAESKRDEDVDPDAPSMGAKSLCIPLEQPELKPADKCIHPACKNKPKFYTLFGRSY